MASIGQDPGGRKRILFVAGDGSRKTVRLGKVTRPQAGHFKIKLEGLVAARLTGKMEDEVARWLAGLEDKAYAKLVRVGLASPRVVEPPASEPDPEPEPTLGEFLNQYIASRIDLKGGTLKVYRLARDRLLGFFEAGKILSTITPGDCDAWRLYLVGRGLAENTIRQSCSKARTVFRSALRRKLIQENPFSELKVSVKKNRTRDYFVTRQDAEKILACCPDIEWKLIFILARYGGLRTPSETLGLRWQDVNWEQGRILIRSPKTEGHEDHESRFVPLFPELRPYLLQAFDEAEPGAEFVITNHRLACGNLRTRTVQIIEKAGVKPWPKLFINCRGSRETELCEKWPEHVVCSWLGNSQIVARKHYLQTTDEHFRQAAEIQNPAHFSAQQPSTNDCNSMQGQRQVGSTNTVFQPVGVDSGDSPQTGQGPDRTRTAKP